MNPLMLRGGPLTLTGSVQALPANNSMMQSLSLQSKSTNGGLVDVLDASGTNIVAQIAIGGSFTVDINSTEGLKVRGTLGNILYVAIVSL